MWETSSEAVLNFNNPQLEDPVAYIVENDVLLDAVSTKLKESQSHVKYGSKIESVNLSDPDGQPKVLLKSGETVSCQLLVSTIFCVQNNSYKIQSILESIYLFDYVQKYQTEELRSGMTLPLALFGIDNCLLVCAAISCLRVSI